MSTTYHISYCAKDSKTLTVHPRAADVLAGRITAWAERYVVSAASAAGTAINLGLIDDGMTAEVDAVHPESLGLICGVLQEVETAVSVICAALARPRPAAGDALRIWQDQQKSAAHTRQEVSAAIETLLSWQQVRVDDLIQATATVISERPVGSEQRGVLNIHDLAKGRTAIHPRVRDTPAKRLDEWATLHDVSATHAASAFLRHGLRNSFGIGFHVPPSEALSIALGEVQTLSTALRTNVPALARARPCGGDARRLWADQMEAANAALTRVNPAVAYLLKILRLSKGGPIGFVAKRIAVRSDPSARIQGGAS